MGQRRTSARRGFVVAGIGIAAVLGVAACDTPTTSPSAAATPTGTAKAGHKGTRTVRGIVGQITAEDGMDWTVVTPKGKSFAVTLTPQTTFGTKKVPTTAQQLTTGMTVRVLGTPTDTTITAVRIAVPARADGSTGAGGATAAPTAAPTPTTAPA